MLRDAYFYRPSEGHQLKHDPFNAIVAPRPIGWISSIDSQGKVNLAPYSFFNAFNYRPPIVGFASIGFKDSVRNAQETGEFCWNMVSLPLAEKMNVTSMAVGAEVDEFVLAKIEKRPSVEVSAPNVADSPVVMECKTSQVIQLAAASGDPCDTWLVMGEVVAVHIANNMIEDGVFQTTYAQPVLRGGGAGDYFTVNDATKFEMFRPS